MSVLTHIATHNFSPAEQMHFGKISGDFNPIHLDTNHARKSMWGECILHGMHGVIWALEQLAQHTDVKFCSADISFIKPIFLNEDIQLIFNEQTKTLQLVRLDMLLTEIRLDTVDEVSSAQIPTVDRIRLGKLSEANFETLKAGQVYTFKYETPTISASDFPCLSNLIGDRRIIEILKISTIVGMHLPGKFSLLSNVKLKFHELTPSPEAKIKFIDRRFKLISCIYNSHYLISEIQAFALNETPKIPPIKKISCHQSLSEYSSIRPIIIGSTRGLGCWLAKILAGGGSNVLGTFNLGSDDALKLIREAEECNVKISLKKFSVGDNLDSIFGYSRANCLFYMATPPIFSKRNNAFCKSQYNLFKKFYVTELENIIRQGHKRKINVFFTPSTEAIEVTNFPVPEYVQAKEESEELCYELSKELDVHIINPRLPALKTDQTNGIWQKTNADIAGHLRPFLQKILALV